MVLGCGNTLLGDDGFGPAVIRALHNDRKLPAGVTCADVGTGIRDHLFNFLLAPGLAPERLIIVDAVAGTDREPGEVFLLRPPRPDDRAGGHDLSLHRGPGLAILQQLAAHTTIDIIAARPARIPATVSPGLSPAMRNAVRRAAGLVLQLLSGPGPATEAGP